ncbi:tetratricopeptide repeat protein [Salidesulfovibrio onnuriiensis]|uniref:tetratricopeptide repeat protein n=1 Tax=Salidesulfovibrio onnuriiensis TaxID=2583823 RepID=UPI0011C8936A|nr:tetratricopeptide repeat protein [Salidesulfovibrio onnuriiensis]
MTRFSGIVVLLLLMVAGGCAEVMGPYYLQQREYGRGIETYSQTVKENPGDSSAWYYLGRLYLGDDKPKEAQVALVRAVELKPDDADYLFWLGVSKWAQQDFDGEREAYKRALSYDDDHVQAMLYLGHNHLDRGEWAEAKALYDRVLKWDRYNPEALYNRAVALGRLGDREGEVSQLKQFLEYYPDGSLALYATVRLNQHGDFTYRNFIIGSRNLTLMPSAFREGTAEQVFETKPSLAVLGAMMEENDKLSIHIVSYCKGDKELARKRAQAVRGYILSGHPHFDPARLPLSWFDVSETVEVRGKKYFLDESVQFITAVPEK